LIGTISDAANQLYEDPEDRAEFARLMQERGVVSSFETCMRRRDGGVIWISVNARVLRDRHGQIIGYEGTVEDITERKKAEEGLRRSLDRLVALHEAGHILGSTLEPEEIGTRLMGIMRRISGLTTAVISLREENGWLGVWRSIGLEKLGPKTRYAPEVRKALEDALEKGATQVFTLDPSDTGPAIGLCLPLRVRERSFGVLEVYGPEALAEKDTVEILESLTSQAASALENARLYGELAERERRLQELVGKILVAQEEERRRVAYEVHDGLAQVAAAAHQHLQAFAQYHSPTSKEGREDLNRVSKLVRQTVGESRRIIADLRPTALDDLGLEAAVRLQLEALRAEGWQISYEGNLDDERLPVSVETALFRVAQEALNNVGKHARTQRISVTLEHLRGPRETVRLSVRDYGAGFSPDAPAEASGPGEQVGLSGMRERVALLGGNFRITSRPGAGTLIVAEVPLWEPVGGPAGDGPIGAEPEA
jgi:signal transduction histidine kinase